MSKIIPIKVDFDELIYSSELKLNIPPNSEFLSVQKSQNDVNEIIFYFITNDDYFEVDDEYPCEEDFWVGCFKNEQIIDHKIKSLKYLETFIHSTSEIFYGETYHLFELI